MSACIRTSIPLEAVMQAGDERVVGRWIRERWSALKEGKDWQTVPVLIGGGSKTSAR